MAAWHVSAQEGAAVDADCCCVLVLALVSVAGTAVDALRVPAANDVRSKGGAFLAKRSTPGTVHMKVPDGYTILIRFR